MDTVLIVITPFEDFDVGDMIIEEDGGDAAVCAEHRGKAVHVAAAMIADQNHRGI